MLSCCSRPTDQDVYRNQFIANWGDVSKIRKPIIAAVSGYAVRVLLRPPLLFWLTYTLLLTLCGHQLGGGCELALLTDIIFASPSATFGQPEITIGTIPGGGGTQRLARAIGKSRTMELVLTGRTFSAQEAERWGMVSRVVGEGEGEVVREAVTLAQNIASKGRLAVQAGKEAVNIGACVMCV